MGRIPPAKIHMSPSLDLWDRHEWRLAPQRTGLPACKDAGRSELERMSIPAFLTHADGTKPTRKDPYEPRLWILGIATERRLAPQRTGLPACKDAGRSELERCECSSLEDNTPLP